MFFPKTYPVIERALLPDVPDKLGDRRVRGRIKEADLAQIAEHEKLELASHHTPGIELMEVVRLDGSVYYEAVAGPNCTHLCAACRGEVDDDMREFGRNAIGVFADSSGGETERLRREVRQLAEVMTAAIQQVKAQLPAATAPQAAIPASVNDAPTRPVDAEVSEEDPS